ncbi:MAG: hypothetical protein ACREQM_18725 [Candidatus Dormibacteraceae bacterium]
MRKIARISKGGQISIPAAVRHRWVTERVEIVDEGESLRVRPLPQDPIGALFGSMPLPPGVTTDTMRAEERAEDARIEAEKERLWRTSH